MDDLFDWYQLASLAAFLALFAGRTVQMVTARGVKVFHLVRGKPWPEAALEALFLVAFPLWLLTVVGHALPRPFDTIPAAWDITVLPWTWPGWIGAGLQLAAVAAFGWSLRSFGESWRVGVDHDSPGALVTDGVFGWSRNPIFLSMDLYLVGAFLLDGRLFTLVFAAGAMLGFHRQILAEERFLGRHYGDTYGVYCSRVRRYLGRAAGGQVDASQPG